jgi:hypothetical protein
MMIYRLLESFLKPNAIRPELFFLGVTFKKHYSVSDPDHTIEEGYYVGWDNTHGFYILEVIRTSGGQIVQRFTSNRTLAFRYSYDQKPVITTGWEYLFGNSVPW